MKILGAFILAFALIGVTFAADCSKDCKCKISGVCKCGEKDKKCVCDGCKCKSPIKLPPCTGVPKHPCVDGCKCGKCGRDCKCGNLGTNSCGSKDCTCNKSAIKQPKCSCCDCCKCGDKCKCDSKNKCCKDCKGCPPKKSCCDKSKAPKCTCCKDCKCGDKCKCDSKHTCVKGCKCTTSRGKKGCYSLEDEIQSLKLQIKELQEENARLKGENAGFNNPFGNPDK